MKASTQKISQSKQKTKVPQPNSVPKIQNFFKSAPKKFVAADIHKNNGASSQSVFIEALKKKLRDANVGPLIESEDIPNENHSSEPIGARDVNVGYVIESEDISNENHSSELIGACAVIGPEEHHTSKGNAHPLVQSDTAFDGEHSANHSSECTRAECINTAKESREWERKYKELKKVYLNLTVNYSEDNVKYKNLVKLKTRATDDTNGVALPDDGIFTPNEIKALQRIAPDKPKDSTFILESLQYAYKSDLSVLGRRTLWGTSERIKIKDDGQQIHYDGKNPLTPEKVERIKQLFIDRISKCDIDSASHGARLQEKNINKLFASGIKNINKKLKERALRENQIFN